MSKIDEELILDPDTVYALAYVFYRSDILGESISDIVDTDSLCANPDYIELGVGG